MPAVRYTTTFHWLDTDEGAKSRNLAMVQTIERTYQNVIETGGRPISDDAPVNETKRVLGTYSGRTDGQQVFCGWSAETIAL